MKVLVYSTNVTNLASTAPMYKTFEISDKCNNWIELCNLPSYDFYLKSILHTPSNSLQYRNSISLKYFCNFIPVRVLFIP